MGQVIFVCVFFLLGIATPFTQAKSEDKYLPAVKVAAEKLSPDRFLGDPVLSQSIDRVNSKIYYKHSDFGSQTVVFQRDISDAGEDVIVIPSKKAGKASSATRSRIYVVLKRRPEFKKLFYATYAYVRMFLQNDDPKESIEVDGKKIRIEWDLWGDRAHDAETGRSIGWDTCSSSVFVTCENGNKTESEIYDYSLEIESTPNLQVSDKGGGVVQPDVIQPEWGVNKVVKPDGEQSFTGTNFGFAEDTGDFMDLTMEGGDMNAPDDIDFFADLDDSSGSSRTGPVISEVDFLSRMGWRTQNTPEQIVADVPGEFENNPFVGFGPCQYRELTVTDLRNIDDPVEAVMFYLFALRTQCSKNHIIKLIDLFNKGLLTVNGDNSLSIPSDNRLTKTSKLTKPEVQDFVTAFETAMFSQVYAAELLKPSVNIRAPDGAKIGRSVFTIVSMSLHSLTQSRKTVPAHYILLIRNLIKTLKSTYVKAVQDNDRVKSCEKCGEVEKDQVLNNVISLKAIQLFITRSLSAVEKGLDPYLGYEYFFNKNKNYIIEAVKNK